MNYIDCSPKFQAAEMKIGELAANVGEQYEAFPILLLAA